MTDYIALASGHIYSKKTNRILKPADNGSGYQHVVLRINNKNVDTYVHRFIAEQLIPNPGNLPEVNHKDGNKSNNEAENLEWVTSSENKKHARDTGLKPPQSVVQRNLDGTFVGWYESAKFAESMTGVRAACIRRVACGTRPMAGGFLWVYREFENRYE